ncbi:hypothetical protein CH375_02315 [Leptospira ellisii]|uniref:Uncharacterized protein n=1 Tax=Leptospira ellisii TaxID=2023197 RepID=A0A2N0B5W8_9LEPT|nr:hypothetical protein CH379_15930 [Leptospira ellisii]PKA05946.1 hypothetical protein CH375_02315 [Leptospira ellisii]
MDDWNQAKLILRLILSKNQKKGILSILFGGENRTRNRIKLLFLPLRIGTMDVWTRFPIVPRGMFYPPYSG